MPGQSRRSPSMTVAFLEPLVRKGLSSVIVFGVVSDKRQKDAIGSMADSSHGPVVQAISLLRASFPTLYVIADVCLCEYTIHGHCGVINEDATLNNRTSVSRLTEVALAYARAGAHCVAPSDMNDGRVLSIKNGLISEGLVHRVMLMSYSAKFSGCLYGPFRDAAGSTPSSGDRNSYQLPPTARGLAKRAMMRDVEEGADVIMVKPAGNYLDIISDAKAVGRGVPVAAYQVSGEYAMIHAAAEAGVCDIRSMAFEATLSILRAGATIIISYFTPQFLEWLDDKDLSSNSKIINLSEKQLVSANLENKAN